MFIVSSLMLVLADSGRVLEGINLVPYFVLMFCITVIPCFGEGDKGWRFREGQEDI
jgi:hypothetical protein